MGTEQEQEGSSGMKFVPVFAFVFGLAVLYFAHHFMSGMVDVLKRGNGIRDVSSDTNAVCQSAVVKVVILVLSGFHSHTLQYMQIVHTLQGANICLISEEYSICG